MPFCKELKGVRFLEDLLSEVLLYMCLVKVYLLFRASVVVFLAALLRNKRSLLIGSLWLCVLARFILVDKRFLSK